MIVPPLEPGQGYRLAGKFDIHGALPPWVTIDRDICGMWYCVRRCTSRDVDKQVWSFRFCGDAVQKFLELCEETT